MFTADVIPSSLNSEPRVRADTPVALAREELAQEGAIRGGHVNVVVVRVVWDLTDRAVAQVLGLGHAQVEKARVEKHRLHA